MTCNIQYNFPIFSVEKVNRDKREYYVFIGTVSEEISNILHKIETRKNIKTEEVRILKTNYPNEFLNWIKVAKEDKNINIKFINNKIYIDDSIREIKNKIFIFLSNLEKKEFIIPENQELWVNSNGKSEIIGYYYESTSIKSKKNNNYKLFTVPHLSEKFSESILYKKNLINSNIKINTSENTIVLVDLINDFSKINNTIYVSDAKDEEAFLQNNKIIINNEIINNYFKKYWPYVNLYSGTNSINEIKNNYLLMNENYKKENYIYDLINNIPINPNVFGACNIINMKIDVNKKYLVEHSNKNNLTSSTSNNVNNFTSNNLLNNNNSNNSDSNNSNNSDSNNNTEENNSNSNNTDNNSNKVNKNVDKNINNNSSNLNLNYSQIDLYQIFDYIREKKIDEKTPYMKYSENFLEAPFSIISKKAVDKNIITKDNLKIWVGVEEQRKINGIIVKRYLKDYNNNPRYSSLFFNKNGQIEINISFKDEYNANFSDIEFAVKDCKNFVEDINKNRLSKDINKIEAPDLDIKNNNIIMKDNTKIVFMNIRIPVNNPIPINFKKLLEFSRNFPFFLAEPTKEIDQDKMQKMETNLKLKYRRVSSFANWNEILEFIDVMKQRDEKDSFILKSLEKKFQKNIDEVKGYLIEWKKKYLTTKSLRVDSRYKKGITVRIYNNNIKLDGITKIYQIPLVYNFFTTFMTLFFEYDKFMKDKAFYHFFTLKENFSKIKYYHKEYDSNQNVKLELDDLYNIDYDYDDNLYLNDIDSDPAFSDSTKISYHHKHNVNFIKNEKIAGLAEDNDIDPNIRLVCQDKIVEKDTCEDFCNDQKYFLRRLQRYDNRLFRYPIDKRNKKQKQYSRGCQQSARQPVVLAYDPKLNPQIKKDSYSYSISYSSDPTRFKRWYICPKIWCPYCEIPICEGDIDPKTIRKRSTKEQGGTCIVAKCPNGEHQVFIRNAESTTPDIYPGFLDSSFHPNNLCLPCCFKNSQENPTSKFYQSYKKCLGDEIENLNIKDGQIYILGKSIIIEKDRYGKLPFEISRILNTKLETGYLGYQSGYLRKGIRHINNNSFLSAISDILSCDKENISISVDKLKSILIDKLNSDLFKTLHNGNLENIFNNPANILTPLENFKSYLLNKLVIIDHTYLWDFLQRPSILFDEGINIFIFDNTNLYCPLGENINQFYNSGRKNILLIKNKEFYESIYYLEGDGKNAIKTCIFDNSKIEIKKLFEISYKGCLSKFDIDWLAVLKNNIKKYDLKIDNIALDLGDSLEKVLNIILLSIKNKKLNNDYLPLLQYVDNYNKVFGIKLKNGLYIPVNPSKLIYRFKYQIVNDVSAIDKLSLLDTLKFNKILIENTGLQSSITHKVLDMKEEKYITALINQKNRFIPIKKSLNNDKKLKISNINYYSDVDTYIHDKLKIPDDRVELVNKSYYENESYIRMKFELSNFLQLPKNRIFFKEILGIINSTEKDINVNRKKLYSVLNKIFSKLVVINTKELDYNDYITPNERIPCFYRSIHPDKKEKNKIDKNDNDNNNIDSKKNVVFSCNDDPHCKIVNKECKLFINEKNLLNIHRNIKNYNYYIARIIDELLRFKIKQNEILYNKIPSIINKKIIKENYKKYIIIHTQNPVEINNLIDKLYYDNKGIFLDERNLYEEITTKEYGFKKSQYIKSDATFIEDFKSEPLTIYWDKYFNGKFDVRINNEDTLLSIICLALNNTNDFKNFKDEKITIKDIKENIIKYLKNNYKNSSKNNSNNNEKNNSNENNSNENNSNEKNSNENNLKNINILELYKYNCDKKFRYITSLPSLYSEILNNEHTGCELDLDFISKIYKVNIIILEKRHKKDKSNFRFIKNNDSYNYILLYKKMISDNFFYNIIKSKNKYIFKLNELPSRFIKNILSANKIVNNSNNNENININIDVNANNV